MARVEAGQQVGQHPVADRPLGEVVDLDGEGVLGLVLVGGQGHVDAVATQEALDRVSPEAHEVGERHIARSWPCRAGGRGTTPGPTAARPPPVRPRRRRIEGERRAGHQIAARDVPRVERLQGVADGDGLGHRPVVRGRRRVEGVEHLSQGYGGRSRLSGELVRAGVGDHQRLGRGEDRVEQQLPVLAPSVALAGQRIAGEYVVAVDRALAREHPVVEAEQAHHAVGHRAHRHHRADGQRAGAEVGPRRSTGQSVGQQRPHVRQPQVDVAESGRRAADAAELALHLARLPAVERATPPSGTRHRRRAPRASGRARGCR